MKIRQAALALVALVAAVTLTSVAAAGPDAARQRVAVTTQASGSTASSPFVLIPLQAGSLRRDSGTWIAGSLEVDRVVVREGQKVSIAEAPSTLKGKLGTLVIRYRTEWVDAGNGHTVGADTWKVVRGTGQYAGVTGGGRGGSVNLSNGSWSSHAEGVLALP